MSVRPYYSEPGISLFLGDCRDWLPTLAAGSVDLVLTDPPFGTEGLGGGYGRRQLHDKGDGKGRCIAGDEDLALFEETWPHLTAALGAGWALVFYAARRTPEFAAIVGEWWTGEVVWDKGAPGLGYTVRYAHESIAVLKLGDAPRPNDALITPIRASVQPVEHPHEKPVRLLGRLLEWASQPGDLVLDAFAGIGGTLVAAKARGRRAIGCELSEAYCEIAARRLQNTTPPLPFDPAPPLVRQLALEVGA